MKRGMPMPGKKDKLYNLKGKPIKIVGISSSCRSKYACAREDPISLQLLKLSLEEAKKAGAQVELIDLRDLEIGSCKECYSTCPAQCRFSEKLNKCDCYSNDTPKIYTGKGPLRLGEAYNELSKEDFISAIQNKNIYDKGDGMHVLYKALTEADGVIFAGSTIYYSRSALMQAMFSRLCALDGGVEELWGDGKNLNNSIKYASNKNKVYKKRLFGRFAAFINVSKEGDSVSPSLMRACSAMGMRIIPLSVCYRVNWYKNPTHRDDMKDTLKDEYSLSLAKFIGKKIVEEAKNSDRIYGMYSRIV